uniref:Uncharacterized protein n=1 Tax=Anguilla anguilla TaxID=7936 RepID=A0A0E9Q3H2_ANGAN
MLSLRIYYLQHLQGPAQTPHVGKPGSFEGAYFSAVRLDFRDVLERGFIITAISCRCLEDGG